MLLNLFEDTIERDMEFIEGYLDDPNAHINFSDILKLGVNPKSIHTMTPLGIYAYPLKQIWPDFERNTIPYAGHRNFVYLLEAQGKGLILQDYTQDQYKGDIQVLKAIFAKYSEGNAEYASRLIQMWADSKAKNPRYNNAGGAFWTILNNVSRIIAKTKQGKQYAVMNGILRSMGYTYIRDNGGGIIHGNEPIQTLFLSAQGYRVIKCLPNPLLRKLKLKSPNRGEGEF